jgi:hypothetical protein
MAKKWYAIKRDGLGRIRSTKECVSDDYSEESGNRRYYKSGYPKFTTDSAKPESLNGPVIIVQKGRKKDGKVE